MLTYFSLKSTIYAYKKGLINPQLSDTFVFNCRRSRVFRDDDLLPGYSSVFENPTPASLRNDLGVSKDELSPEAYQKWLEFFEIIKIADEDNRILWLIDESGNPAYFDEKGDCLNIISLHAQTPEEQRFSLSFPYL